MRFSVGSRPSSGSNCAPQHIDTVYQVRTFDSRCTFGALSQRLRHCANAISEEFSFVCPHFPLIARPEWYSLYPEESVPRPALCDPAERPDHPYVAALRECQIHDKGFDGQKLRKAIAAYFGLVSFVDHNVGQLLKVPDQTGLAGETRVIYRSDHGDNLGTLGLWGKSTMYEESAGVPMIMARHHGLI